MAQDRRETSETWRGKLGGTSREEMEEFLEQGLPIYLACLKSDGYPYITVCWHEWRDGYFWVVPRQRSRWAQYLKNDPRVSFMVERSKPLQKVSGEGLAELIEEPNIDGRWVAVATRMSYRYLGTNGPTYLEPTLRQPRWLFRIQPAKIKTWQGVGWARRYWVEGTGGPSYEEAHAQV